MKILRRLLFVMIILSGCNDSIKNEQYSYPENINISDSCGVPISIESFYFPFNKQINSDMDTLENRINSSILFSAKEPILYNYYLNKVRFRLLIEESWKPIKIINFIKEKNEILIETKTLSIHSFVPEVQRFSDNFVDSGDKHDSVQFLLNKTKLSDKWEGLNNKIEGSNFWKIENTGEINGQDGTRVILEGHTKDKYWFVNRWEPGAMLNDTNQKEGLIFKGICDYMAKLAGEKINW